MSYCKEQLGQSSYCGHRGRFRYRAGSRRWQKRQASRAMRRRAKRDPENAPTKYRYHGWP